jgi:L-lactate utilization protein LutC
MDDVRKWFYEIKVAEAVKNLIKHGFEAIRVSDRSAACNEILNRVPSNKTVGLGGSVTLREIGLISLLEKQGNILYDHWKQGITQEESLRIRRAQQSSDVYITSANAITLSGEIVNIDGACNRTSAMGFGPQEVIILAGRNKIVQDVSAGIARIKNEAAPLNARRLGLDLPCAKLGRCVECDSPQRICRGTLILERRPLLTNMLVIVVEEELGY